MKPVKLAFVAVPLLLGVRPADACSPLQCWPGALVPSNGATVPASAEAFYWHPISGQADADPAAIRLVATSAPETPLAVTTTELANGDYLVRPVAPLAAGTEYRLEDSTICAGVGQETGPSSTFTTTAAVPLPTSLGTLGAAVPSRGTLSVSTSSGSCSAEVEVASAVVTLDLDATAEPWLQLLHFETFVDDQVWAKSPSILASSAPGASWTGRGTDTIFSVCASADSGASQGVAEGTHVVRMEATLPGTSLALASSSVTIQLECDPDDGGDGDTDDGVTDGTDADDTEGPADGGDGGCSSSGGGGLLVALGAIGALARRRRRSSVL